MIILPIFGTLFLIYLIFLLYIEFTLSKHRFVNNIKLTEPNELIKKITIIIPFKDEQLTLINHFSSIKLVEGFSDSNIVYVNDHSSDDSLSLISNLTEDYPNVLVLNSPLDRGKKNAVSFAISKIDSEFVLLTDADCTYHPNWLQSIVIPTGEDSTGFVAGGVQLSYNSFFSEMQQIEFASLIIVGAAFIVNGKPIICNAANVLFRRELFNEVNGYEGFDHIVSGDDVFLMQKIAKLTPSKIVYNNLKSAIVTTEPAATLTQFFLQRMRWAGKTTSFLDFPVKVLLTMVFLFYVFYIILFTTALFDIIAGYLFLVSLLLKVYLEYRVILKGGKILSISTPLRYFLPLAVLHPIYITISVIGGFFRKKKW